jgi:putative flippase GtrA
VKILALRWLKFNLVGAMGIAIQLGCLAIVRDLLHVHYLAATALAVEAAVLHNFIWHQRFTWKERTDPSRRAVLLRLCRFHLGNGLISMLGNLALMWILVGGLQLHHLIANAISIGLCSLANFAAGEWFVFRPGGKRQVRGESKIANETPIPY